MLHRVLFSLSEVTLLQNNNSNPCTRPQRPVPESLINVNLPLRMGPNNSTKANAEISCTSSFLITMQFRHSMPQSFYQGVERDWFKLEEREHYKAESSASVQSKAFRCILQALVISVGALTRCVLLLHICLRTNEVLTLSMQMQNHLLHQETGVLILQRQSIFPPCRQAGAFHVGLLSIVAVILHSFCFWHGFAFPLRSELESLLFSAYSQFTLPWRLFTGSAI